MYISPRKTKGERSINQSRFIISIISRMLASIMIIVMLVIRGFLPDGFIIVMGLSVIWDKLVCAERLLCYYNICIVYVSICIFRTIL